MKKSILIAAPYLNNIGGTEIEAVTTAVYFYDTNFYKNIVVFTPYQINSKLFVEILGSRNIKFITYPKFFLSKTARLLNRLFIKFGFSNPILEYMYWKFKSSFFQYFYILTYPRAVYLFSILQALGKQKITIVKITMWQFENLPKNHLKYFKKVHKIIVFNQKQKEFWQIENQLNNIESLDILIPNERNLLGMEPTAFVEKKCINFGYLGRISEEKNIEDMIRLLNFLINIEKQSCRLIIQGSGEIAYVNKLKQLAEKLLVWEYVDFKNTFIDPMKSHLFFREVDVFLVTSINEGGPMTALEAAAAGRMILSYNVGAMNDRFSKHLYVINNTFDELCLSSLQFMQLPTFKKREIVLDIKENYKLKLCNNEKGTSLQKIVLNGKK